MTTANSFAMTVILQLKLPQTLNEIKHHHTLSIKIKFQDWKDSKIKKKMSIADLIETSSLLTHISLTYQLVLIGHNSYRACEKKFLFQAYIYKYLIGTISEEDSGTSKISVNLTDS